MTTETDISYTMACYIIDGLNINNHSVIGTDLKTIPVEEGGGYRATIYLEGQKVESMSRLGWLEATELAVREVLRRLGSETG